jgi:single-stranded-DNA-specific exonuclease
MFAAPLGAEPTPLSQDMFLRAKQATVGVLEDTQDQRTPDNPGKILVRGTGFHLRDALDLVSKRHPGVLLRFGGHAMAAGCTLGEGAFDTFDAALQQVAREWLDAATLARTLPIDGPLATEYFNVETIRAIDAQVWGQAFEAPVWADEVDVITQRLVGEKHLKLTLRHAGSVRDAIWFGHSEPLPGRVRLAYRLSLDEYNGRQRVQMVVEAAG